jgi:predicted negative regulator of RcsB-dependent stress response
MKMKTNTKKAYLNTLMMAITFAEAGEYATAKGMLEQVNQQRKRTETRVEQRPALEL